ncbi:MAG TPA: hypothetical protein VEC35_01180 [Noviherbaspirillum sp.]|nr:hypothetical protein [Noviherbaspirillum sp.]
MTNSQLPSMQTAGSSGDPMDWLFGQLHGAFGNQFLDKWRSGHVVSGKDTGIENMKQVWAQKIRENGMTFADIKRGLKACDKAQFPPTWSEFLEMCKPRLDPLAAYYEAVNGVTARDRGEVGEWSHPAIFFAAIAVGAFDLKNLGYSQIKVRWEKALAAELAKGAWGDIPQPTLSLPAPGQTALSKERAEQLVQDYGAAEAFNSDKVDHRAWVGKLLDRISHGDRSVPPIAARLAQEVATGRNLSTLS